jgi:predicted DNA-binding protein (UPF0251 family)
VEQFPEVTYFKPSGIPVSELSEIILTVEELESIRLRDLEGMEQEECAEKMAVSRPTFHRVLAAARQKVAFALVNGAALRITGGNFKLAHHRLSCRRCGQEWEGTICRCTVCPSCSVDDWQRID